jgi:hypothetical protein
MDLQQRISFFATIFPVGWFETTSITMWHALVRDKQLHCVACLPGEFESQALEAKFNSICAHEPPRPIGGPA